jgi:prepilin-type N-terminal cleavage/methylation domain-containing protein
LPLMQLWHNVVIVGLAYKGEGNMRQTKSVFLQDKQSGFTLVELLVVVAIIALLISILLPSLGKSKELANRVYCAANLRGVGQSLNLYAYQNNGIMPVTYAPISNGPGSELKWINGCCAGVELSPLSRNRSVTTVAGVYRPDGRTSHVSKRTGSARCPASGQTG